MRMDGFKIPILKTKASQRVEGLEVYNVLGYYQVGEVLLEIDENDPEVQRIVSEFLAKILPHVKTTKPQDLVTS
ncbi:MAG: hypothetical protein UU10_C0049G0006 [Parcubacteria group bacterium GW2011_GWF1_40_6]|nr:MAG: hypothetical protein UU10_C0049G0006 [Parcubacteria group bacterium GW2011_GWF1_40_6]